MTKKSRIAKALKLRDHSTRSVNRCQLCGRSRGYYRHFGLCRLCMRDLAHKGELPGLVKSSF